MTAVAIIRSNPAFLKSSVTLTEDAVIILFPTALSVYTIISSFSLALRYY